MNRLFLLAFFCLLGSSCANDAVAQGLTGSAMPKEIQGRLSYIKGATDQERWRTFLDVQPKLIGMRFGDIDQALCGQPTHRLMAEVEYGLTKEPVNLGKSKSWVHVRVYFRNGIAWKYVVQTAN